MVGSRVVLAVGEGEDYASAGSMENYDWLEQSDEDQGGEAGSGQASAFPEVPGHPSAKSEEVKVREEELPEQEVDTEVVQAKCAKVPRQPTAEERRKHDLTHWPFRDWCEFCQRGKAANRAHRRGMRKKIRRKDEEEDNLPVVSMDYMFLEYSYSREKRGETEKEAMEKGMRPILVVHDSRSSAVFAHDVGRKGLQGTPAKWVEKDLRDLGYWGRDLVLKGD